MNTDLGIVHTTTDHIISEVSASFLGEKSGLDLVHYYPVGGRRYSPTYPDRRSYPNGYGHFRTLPLYSGQVARSNPYGGRSSEQSSRLQQPNF